MNANPYEPQLVLKQPAITADVSFRWAVIPSTLLGIASLVPVVLAAIVTCAKLEYVNSDRFGGESYLQLVIPNGIIVVGYVVSSLSLALASYHALRGRVQKTLLCCTLAVLIIPFAFIAGVVVGSHCL